MKAVKSIMVGVLVAIFANSIGIEALTTEWWIAVIALNAAILIS